MNLRTAAAGVTLAATVAVGAVACAPQPASPEGPRSLTVAILSTWLDVNFTDSTHAGWIFYPTTQAVFEPLIRRNVETGAMEGVLASDFAISDDARTVEFTIRDGVSFTNGEELTADGVAEVLEAAFTNEDSWIAFLQAQYDMQISATGNVVQVTTSKPVRYVPFLSWFEFIPIVSPAALGSPADDAPFPSTGPYVVDEIVAESSVSFVRNPDYWNPDAYPFDTVTFRTFDDRVAALNALKSGQVDVAEVNLQLLDEVEGSGFAINTGQYLEHFIQILDLGGELIPALADVRVRQAMNMAFDREAIAATLGGGYGKGSSQPFLPERLEYVDGGDDRYPYDPQGARDLLADAGYPDGFTFTIATYSGIVSAIYEPVIEQSLADIGITVEWERAAAPGDLGPIVGDSNDPDSPFTVPALMIAGNADQPGLGAASPRTVKFLDDPAWDELVEIRDNGTLTEYEDVAPRIAEYILDNALYVTVAQDPSLWASTPDVEIGFPPLGVTFMRLADIQLAG